MGGNTCPLIEQYISSKIALATHRKTYHEVLDAQLIFFSQLLTKFPFNPRLQLDNISSPSSQSGLLADGSSHSRSFIYPCCLLLPEI